MLLSRSNSGILRSLGLAIACSSVAVALTLPARSQDYQRNTVNNRHTNSSYQKRPRAPRSLSQQNNQPTQNTQINSTQSSLSPEEIERQSVQQNRWLQDLEWRRQYGDLDPTPVGK